MKLSKFTSKALAAAVFAGLALTSVASHGATISSLFVPGNNTIEDSDAERLLDSTGAVKAGGQQYVVGDAIESIVKFTDVNADLISDTLGSPYQFNGYSKLVVSSIDLLFDADSSGGITLNDGIRLHFGTLGDTLVSVYERLSGDTSVSLGNTMTPSQAITTVTTLQTFIADFGLGEADDYWYADTVNNSSAITLAVGGGQVAAGVFGLTMFAGGDLPIETNGVLSTVDGNMHDVVGDASVFGRQTGVNTGWQVSSNIEATFNVVPEPATLALLGAGLIGMGASSVRRRRKA